MRSIVLKSIKEHLQGKMQGYKHLDNVINPNNVKSSDFPFISYIPTNAKINYEMYNKEIYKSNWELVIYIGIFSTGKDNAVIKLIDTISEIITNINQFDYSDINGVEDIKVSSCVTDKGIFHPYYYAEVVLDIKELINNNDN